ncbi:hypothetical protein EDC01DRAFT_742717 [Geopyxis carbonaria]|nr:hypothetical protein EDC01DRAFT_742717 [Geopyxis carbonaria]
MSAPDSAALRAATLSFAKKRPASSTAASAPPPPLQPPLQLLHSSPSPSRPSSASSRNSRSRRSSVVDRSPSRLEPEAARELQPRAPKSSSRPPTHARSNSALAASLAFARSPPAPTMATNDGDVLPDRGTVLLRRKMFQDGAANSRLGLDDVRRSPPPLHVISPERSRPGSPEKVPVDSAPIEDVTVLKSLFEAPALGIQAPKPIHVHQSPNNPSLTAAVLATQLSPPGSAVSSRRTSPTRQQPSSPKRETVVPVKVVRKPVPPPVKQKPASIRAVASWESIASTDTARSSALAAATLAHSNSTSPQPPPVVAPKPPPPRTRRTPAPTTDPPAADNSFEPPPLPPRANTFTTLPPPLPNRATSPAKTAAALSHTAASTPPPLPRAPTGDSAIAASLAPSRTTTPGPRKLPPPSFAPPPRRLPPRRKSLPTLHPTLRPPRPRSRSPPPPKSRGALTRPSHHHAESNKPHYRAAVPPKERKRYEGLWAANRGLHLPPELADGVLWLVVKDIWSRSRLGDALLAEIYELVWGRGEEKGREARPGWLEREEFVVGTWLVDLALRGRKMPVRVEEGVWESVRPLGVALPPPVPPARRGGR